MKLIRRRKPTSPAEPQPAVSSTAENDLYDALVYGDGRIETALRAQRLIAAHRDLVRHQTIEHLRWMTWDGHPSPWFHMVADKLRGELIGPDMKEQP